MRKLLCLLLVLLMCTPALAEKMEPGMPWQPCHEVTATKADTTQKNQSVIRLWTLDTYDDNVDAELAAITGEYVERLGPTLQKAGNKTTKNSR